jgi:aldehyde:ferredoxin oxidoreductase
VEGGKYDVDPKYGGPEYETMAAFGSLCGVDDLEAILKGHEICNRLGIDTISSGMTITWLMECVEKGIMTSDEAGVKGFGDAEGMLKLLEKIAAREGIGDLLAEGSRRAAEKIGKGSEKFVMTVKSQELPMHEPRGKKGVGLGYVISPTGADHMQVTHDSMLTAPDSEPMNNARALGILDPMSPASIGPEKVRAVRYLWFFWAVFNHLGCCYFVFAPRSHFPISRFDSLVEAATGWNVTLWELMKMGERGLNAARLFNIKMGLNADDDVLPERLREPLQDGAFKGQSMDEEFDKAKDLFYSMMNWDEKGVPVRAKLEELELGEYSK